MSARTESCPTTRPLVDEETKTMDAFKFVGRSWGRGPLTMLATCVAMLLACVVWSAPASADFELENFDFTIVNQDGSADTQAGSHPYALKSSFNPSFEEVGFENYVPSGDLKTFVAEQVAGLTGNATVVPRCNIKDFLSSHSKDLFTATSCPDDTAVGVSTPRLLAPQFWTQAAVFNLEPPPGIVARFGFLFLSARVIVDVGVKGGGEYNVVAALRETPQIITVFGGGLELWGDPSDPGHDHYRGGCLPVIVGFALPNEPILTEPGSESCPVSSAYPEEPFLTLPRSCTGPAELRWRAESWWNPGAWIEGSQLTHDTAVPPNPQGFTGCGKLAYEPTVESRTTAKSAETGTGLEFNLSFGQEGLLNRKGLAGSDTKKAVVTLPEGVTVNPSIGEGLGVCTPADYERESLSSAPGEGCPNSSKIGTLHAETPLVDEGIDGSVYLAQQDDPATTNPGAENPFDSLIAIYLVLRNPNLGAIVKLAAKVEPDPVTGQLVTTLDNSPQVPLREFDFRFREGQRAPLVTPGACGTYTTEAKLYPWSDPSNPRTVVSSFEITEGKGGAPCPPGGVPPFNPKFEAGSINNNAGSFSPFDMRITREDGEQDMTKFSAILPPGEVGSLAGVDKCPDAAIAIAKAKQGREELASPSCPANSLIGHTLAGAGVGSALTYVKGQVYLGGAYHGDPLSAIAITPAVAGPFDAGTVVVQLALTLNPKTAEVEVDGANSDPIPHIIKGIVLKLRDLRVSVDRPNFTLNPTSCDESSARAVLFGSFLNVLDPSDDKPVNLSTRYQAANCLNLGFKPKLGLTLKGGTKRGGHPGLRAIYTPRKGDANVKGLVVRLPRSAFLDQAHIKTICTRVQFAADSCPKQSQYGYIKAYTPLLETPLEGPVYLRSSNHKLPDLVFDLHGLVDIEVSTRLDSQNGGIRATVEDAPDAPLSKVDLRMQGAKKGLIINSRNLCGHVSKANVTFTGHNGKEHSSHPVMKADCGGKRKHKR